MSTASSFLPRFQNDTTKAKNFIEKFRSDGERADEYLKKINDMNETTDFGQTFSGSIDYVSKFIKSFDNPKRSI